MRTVSLKSGSFKIHESQKQLPINRYTDFQKYVMQDVGIGSDMSDVERHFKVLDTLLGASKIDEARQERYNLHVGLYLAINRININNISFACLVHSINEVELTDFSENNLMDVCDQLGNMGLSYEMVSDILESVKKNLILK